MVGDQATAAMVVASVVGEAVAEVENFQDPGHISERGARGTRKVPQDLLVTAEELLEGLFHRRIWP